MSSVRRVVVRFLIVLLTLGFSGWTFGATGYAAGLAHDLEATATGAGDPATGGGAGVPDCAHKCQAHYSQHFKAPVLTVSASAVAVPTDAPSAVVGSSFPPDPLFSLFRPPRLSSL